jgi:hypothetical protein
VSARDLRPRLAAGLALAVGGVVFLLATDLFPYHSVNDDEGVYLTQAALLLDGQLFLHPGEFGTLVRPWFFVVDQGTEGLRMYGKYAPVAPAIFAAGLAVGVPRLSLAAVAAGNAALVYALTAAGYDRTTGLVAVLVLAASPLFLLNSAVFLAYAPTTLFALAFAVAYVRAARRGRVRDALFAGAAIGVAFFSRPYTAVLFAAPFVAHALLSLGTAWRRRERLRPTVLRYGAIAGVGLAFVGASLGYNAVVTGDPLVFPYQAFAPLDGLGFGRRRILGYERVYTPALAFEATRETLVRYLTDWTAAGVVGTGLAAVGLGRFAVRARGAALRPALDGMPEREVRAVVALLVPSIVVGEAYFWGTMNALDNGLLALLGPYYHFDLLVPLSTFGAAGAVTLVGRGHELVADRIGPRRANVAVAIALLVAAPMVAAAEAQVLGEPVAENRQRTESLRATYEPFERTDLDDALVFTPDPWGDWLHHPFQWLRNEPGFGGDAVYVLDGAADDDFRALDAAPDRRPYRFTYRGRWTGAVRPVESRLVALSVLEGARVDAETTVGVPAGVRSATVRVETPRGYARYDVPSERLAGARAGDGLRVTWRVSDEGVRVRNLPRAGGDGATLPDDPATATLLVTAVYDSGATLTYRQAVSVDGGSETVRVLWPPETRVCRLTTDCGREGTWIGPEGDYVSGVAVESNATAAGSTRAGRATPATSVTPAAPLTD